MAICIRVIYIQGERDRERERERDRETETERERESQRGRTPGRLPKNLVECVKTW